MNKTFLNTSNLTEVYTLQLRRDPSTPVPQVIASSSTSDGVPFELRQLVIGNIAWTEQHLKTHEEDKPEMLVCLPLPNKKEVLDRFRPVVYTDCDDVYCDCNKEWPWLKHIKQHTYLLPEL